MAPASHEIFHQVVGEHQARLERIAERRGVSRLKRVYDEAHDEVQRKLRKLAQAGKGDTFTAHHKRVVMAQLIHGQAYVNARLGAELTDAAKEARHDVLRALAKDVGRLERKFTGHSPILPIEDAARFAGVIDKRKTSLLTQHRASVDRYGSRVIAQMEDALAKSVISGESHGDAYDRLGDIVGGEFYQVERIARTELAWAANATAADGLHAVREVIPDMMIQWRELVSDTGQPLDDRVGIDSLALHGQVAVPGAMFTCPARAPDGEEVPEGLQYEEVAFPPNRPNDRSTLAPWRASWGIPGWRWVSGRRVPMR